MKKGLGLCIAILFLTWVGASGAEAAIIHDVRVTGVPVDQFEAIKTLSGFLPGDETDTQRIERAIKKIQDFYEAKGYPQAKITSEVQTLRKVIAEKNEASVLVFHVNPGPPVRILQEKFSFKGESGGEDVYQRLRRH